MKRKYLSLLLCVLMMTALLPALNTTAEAIGQYGVNLDNNCYKSANAFAWGQCTWYCWGRAYEKLGIDFPRNGYRWDAKDWPTAAAHLGYAYDSNPSANSIAVWTSGGTGHVAFVEKVEGDIIYITESNVNYYQGYVEGFMNLATGYYECPTGVIGFQKWYDRERPSGYIHLTPVTPPAAPTVYPLESVYYLRSALDNNLVIGISGESTDWGGNVQLEKYNGNPSQRFRIAPYNNGNYTIRNVNSSLAMDVENASNAPGANVQQYYYWPDQTSGQQWYFENAGNGYYYIRSALGTYLDVQGGVAANGRNIQTYTGNGSAAQKWKLEAEFPFYGTENSAFYISWNSVSGATSYSYYLTEYPEGYAYTTNARSGTTTGTSIIFKGSELKNGRYSFFLHANNSAGQSPQSNWVSFDIYAGDYVPTKTAVHNGHIYALYDYEMSWSFARDLCTNMGGHLLTINNQTEQTFIESLMAAGKKDAYWLGGNNFETTASDVNLPYKWVTGEAFSYTNWKSGEPSFSGERGTRERFTEIRKSYGNKWNDVHNTNKSNKGFILEIEPKSSDITYRGSYGGSQYLIIDRNITWSEAKVYCEMLGGHLYTIDSSGEAAYVDGIIKNGTRGWYYCGASKQNGTWKWLDGRTASGLTWRYNWPNNYLMKYKASLDYAAIGNTYYPAHDIKHIGFICEIPAGKEVLSFTKDDVETDAIKLLRWQGMDAASTGEPRNRGYDPTQTSDTVEIRLNGAPMVYSTANLAKAKELLKSVKYESLTYSGAVSQRVTESGSGLRVADMLSISFGSSGGNITATVTALKPVAMRLTMADGSECLIATPGDVNLDGSMDANDWTTIMRWTLQAPAQYDVTEYPNFTLNGRSFDLWALLADMTGTTVGGSRSNRVDANDWTTIMYLTLQAWKK